MKIIFYTEGGRNIGLGHINRCLSLAQAFNFLDYECQFIISGDDSVKNLISDFNVNVIDWISDPNYFSQDIEKNDILVFDSYNVPIEMINKIAKLNNNLVFFDDYDRLEYPAGIIINGALNAESIYTKRKSELKYLLGSTYQPIRKEFWELEVIRKNQSIKNVLITFGGDDPRNLTLPVMKFLNDFKPNIIKTVIVGKSFSNTDSINKFQNDNTNLIFNPSAIQICDLMLKSDIAICGAGQTLYELARTKTPTFFIGIAKNQKNNIKSWSNNPFFNFVGWWNSSDIIGRLHESFVKFDEYFKEIAEDIYSSNFIIDGNGSKNIVEKVLSYVRTK